MDLYRTTNGIKTYIKKTNWKEDDFCKIKAFICSCFSELSYSEVTGWELDKNKRVKLFRSFSFYPSLAYEEIIKSGMTSSIVSLLNESEEFREFEFRAEILISTELVTIIKFMIFGVEIISIRGTGKVYKNSYDWLINLDFLRADELFGNVKLAIHKGFLKEADKIFKELKPILIDENLPTTPLYFTGHSLGGALATIINMKWNSGGPNRSSRSQSYTFGMPRYTTSTNVKKDDEPFHIINQLDIVPHTPPSRYGFQDPLNERTIVSNNSMGFTRPAFSLEEGRKLLKLRKCSSAFHKIELYRERLGDLI